LPLARLKQDGPETREALGPPLEERDWETPAPQAPTPTALSRARPEAAKNKRPCQW
jgi:hypothetical protein